MDLNTYATNLLNLAHTQERGFNVQSATARKRGSEATRREIRAKLKRRLEAPQADRYLY